MQRPPGWHVWFTRGERYKCNGCIEEGGNIGFRCKLSSCANIRLHQKCAQLPDVYNSIHVQEELTFRPRTFFSHKCNACGKTLGGFVFSNSSHSLRFHPLCITLPQSFDYGGHKIHPLKLVKVGDGSYTCGFCNKSSQGWRYACEKCPFILDLTCAKLDLQGLVEHPSQDQAIQKEGNLNGIIQAAMGEITVRVVDGFLGAVFRACDQIDGAVAGANDQIEVQNDEVELCED